VEKVDMNSDLEDKPFDLQTKIHYPRRFKTGELISLPEESAFRQAPPAEI
jgi:hypothetical protein